jgi:hypothetical protein
MGLGYLGLGHVQQAEQQLMAGLLLDPNHQGILHHLQVACALGPERILGMSL